MTKSSDLGAACAFWQAGRDGGSTLLRGAARVITGVPHYFCAPFIHEKEEEARHTPIALFHGAVLLNELERAPSRTASEWAVETKVADHAFAGRGLKSAEQDDKIEERLDTGRIDMPLWGLSLDRTVTQTYGERFLLEVVGPFPAIPAWLVSHVKEDEQELVTGGRYAVESVERSEGTTLARLRWESSVESRRICDAS
ncbi:MAG: hypothetical protein ACRYG2_14230 [Janthinobacterium lividum]